MVILYGVFPTATGERVVMKNDVVAAEAGGDATNSVAGTTNETTMAAIPSRRLTGSRV
jgi:hypothetical protein